MESSPAFIELDWDAPLDTDARIAEVPASRKVRGLALTALVRCVKDRTGQPPPGWPEFIAFKSYPMAELITRTAEAAALAFPDAPPRRGIFEVGRYGYRAVTSSMIGKVIFAFGAEDVHAALNVVSRIYATVGDSDVEVTEREARRAVVTFANVWSFPDCYHVGVFTEGFARFDLVPQVRVRRHSRCHTDLELVW